MSSQRSIRPPQTDDVRMKLLELDHADAVRVVEGTLKTLSIVRGWTVTVWLGLVAAAVQVDNAWIAGLAFVPLVVFYLHDGYVSWSYREALGHACRVERVWQAAYDSVSRGQTDDAVVVDAEAKIQAHRLGVLLEFPRFRRSDLRRLVPAHRFWWVYAILCGCTALACVVLALTGPGDPRPGGHQGSSSTPHVKPPAQKHP